MAHQWLAINDFIPGICGADVVKKLLPHCGRKEPAWKNKPTLN